MPTYEYECIKCGKRFELVQSMKDEALKICPKEVCPKRVWGKGKVRRLVGTGAGLIFKGSGFYATDYRSESYKQAAKKETDAAAPKKSDSVSSKSSTTKEISTAKSSTTKEASTTKASKKET